MPDWAAEVCEVPVESIVQAARMFGNAKAVLSLYCQGLNQSINGTYKNSALINLHLATGQIGRPGAGPFSLTGQPNAMGGREVGGMANLLSAHRDLASEKDRAEVAKLWGVPSVPSKPGKTAVELFDAIGPGDVRMVWIACTNPAQSMPDAHAVRARCRGPSSWWCRTPGSMPRPATTPTSCCPRRPGRRRRARSRIPSGASRACAPPCRAPGEARPDWKIAVEFARRSAAAEKLFPYENSEDIFNEHRETTRGRDLDITGLVVRDPGGARAAAVAVRWREGRERLYEDGVFPTPSGRARFVAAEYVPPAEVPDADFPAAADHRAACATSGTP